MTCALSDNREVFWKPAKARDKIKYISAESHDITGDRKQKILQVFKDEEIMSAADIKILQFAGLATAALKFGLLRATKQRMFHSV